MKTIHIGNFREEETNQFDTVDAIAYIVATLFPKMQRVYGESDDSFRFRIKEELSFRPVKINYHKKQTEARIQARNETVKEFYERRRRN